MKLIKKTKLSLLTATLLLGMGSNLYASLVGTNAKLTETNNPTNVYYTDTAVNASIEFYAGSVDIDIDPIANTITHTGSSSGQITSHDLVFSGGDLASIDSVIISGGTATFKNLLSVSASGKTIHFTIPDLPSGDSSGTVIYSFTSSTNAPANTAPTITGAIASQAVNDTATITPFSGVTLADNENDNLSLTITLDDNAKGSLSATSISSDTISNVQTALRAIVFTPAQNRVAVGSTETTTFTITANDGTDDSIPNTTTTVVSTSINDSPTLPTNIGLTLNEGATGTISSTKLSASDVDDTATGLTYTLTSIPSNGTLKLNGSDLSTNGTFTQNDINTNIVTYVHNGGETTSDSFNFSLADGGENSATPLTGQTFNFTITAQNDNPTMSGIPTDIVVNEDIVSDVDLSATTLSDSDAGSSSVTLNLSISGGTFSTPADGAAVGSGVTETLVNSTEITLVGTIADINTYLDTTTNIGYQGVLNSNGDNIATLTIKANDGGNTGAGGGTLVTLGTSNIDITAINDAPTITSGSDTTDTVNVAENITAVKTVTATDVDNADTITYSISGGADQAKFNINSSSGVLTFISAPNFENKLDSDTNNDYIVEVTATDSGSLTDTQTITVTVTNANDAPTNITLSNNSILTASTGVNSVVGTLSATDEDTGDSFTFTMGSTGTCTDNASFNMNSTSLRTSGALGANTYSICINVSDGNSGSFDKDFTITVTANVPAVIDLDLDNSSTSTGNDYSATFTEDGSAVAIADSDVTISDSESDSISTATITLTNDQDTTNEYLISTVTNANITVTGDNSDTITLTNAGSASYTDFQNMIAGVKYTNSSNNPNTTDRVINVVLNDGFSNGSAGVATISITPTNDAPTITTNTGLTAIEKGSSNNAIANTALSSSDVDLNTITYTITTAPIYGTLKNTNTNTDLILNSTFTQSDINNNYIAYNHTGSDTTADSFIFKISDGTAEVTNQTFNITIADTTSPTAVFNPLNSGNIAINGTITITFNEAIRNIDDSEITDSNVASLITFKLTNSSGVDVTFTATIDANKKVVTITPSANLTESQNYYMALANVEDVSGNLWTTENITISAIPDTTAPTISTLNPTNSATDVSITPTLTLTFDETIQAGSGAIEIKKVSDNSVVETITLPTDTTKFSISNAILTLTPTTTLDFSTGYYVNIASGAIKDNASTPNDFAGISDNSTYSFTTRAQNAGTLEFNSATYSVAENGATVTITVSRSGGSDGAVSVEYSTSDGTALAGTDYTAIPTGTLNWSDGDSADKTFDVTITNDSSVESDETLTLTLSNPLTANLGTQTTATLTITNDDSTPSPTPAPSSGGGGSTYVAPTPVVEPTPIIEEPIVEITEVVEPVNNVVTETETIVPTEKDTIIVIDGNTNEEVVVINEVKTNNKIETYKDFKENTDGTNSATVDFVDSNGKVTKTEIKTTIPKENISITSVVDGVETKAKVDNKDGSKTETKSKVNNNGTVSSEVKTTDKDGKEVKTKISSTKVGSNVEIAKDGSLTTSFKDNHGMEVKAVATTNGEVHHEIDITDDSGNIVKTVAKSNIAGSQVVIKEDGSVQTSAKTTQNKSEILSVVEADSEGRASHILQVTDSEGNSVITKAQSQIKGATTTITENGVETIAKATTTFTDNSGNSQNRNIEFIVDAKPDGGATHKLSFKDENGQESITEATSEVKGATTTIKTDNTIETKANVSDSQGNQNEVVAQALSNGNATHSLTSKDKNGNNVKVEATSELPNTKTVIKDSGVETSTQTTNDSNQKVDILVTGTKEGYARHEVTVNENGRGQLLSTRSTYASSEIKGAKTLINKSGLVQTNVSLKSSDGTITEAFVDTTPDGQSHSYFKKFDSNGVKLSTQSTTQHSNFELGNNAIIKEKNGKLLLDITTKVSSGKTIEF